MVHGVHLGIIRLHILYRATQAPVYGLATMHELRRHGYDLNPGALYPMLRELEEAEYLDRENQTVNGKARKDYTATAEGIRALVEARIRIMELAAEVVDGNNPPLPAPDSDNDDKENRH